MWWRRGERDEKEQSLSQRTGCQEAQLLNTQSAFRAERERSPATLPGSERSPIVVLVAPDRRWSCEAFHGSHICRKVHTHTQIHMSQEFHHLYSFHPTSLLTPWPTVQLLPFILPSFLLSLTQALFTQIFHIINIKKESRYSGFSDLHQTK